MREGYLVVAGLAVALLGAAAAMGLMAPAGGTAGLTFADVADDVGLEYTGVGSGISNTNAGVYVADYDRDGWQDVLAVGGRRPVLFENRGGRFVRSGDLPPLDARRIHGVLFVDYDADGWRDLLVLVDPGVPRGDYTPPNTSTGGGGTATNATTGSGHRRSAHPILLHNDGGTFSVDDVLENVSLQRWPIGATAGDYNRDGCPDAFVYQDGDWADRTPVGYHDPSSVGNVTDDNGEPNILLRGTCEGFERVNGTTAGITGERWSLAASMVDFTGDGWPDIHVANDYNEDYLYVNQRNGTFRPTRLGDETDRNGMSSEVADVNGDGRLDVFVTNIGDPMDGGDVARDTGGLFLRKARHDSPRHRGNTLLLNRGNGTFVNRASAYGVRQSPALWGWAAVIADLDDDGDRDLVHTNNEKSSITSNGGQLRFTRRDTPLAVWEGTGDGFTAVAASAAGFDRMNGRGVAQLDYDRDGDLDLVVADDGDAYALYENRGAPGNSLQVTVASGEDDATTLGARVTTVVDGESTLRVANARADFLSQESRVLHVGLGEDEVVDRLRVVWPDGTTRVFRDVAAGHVVVHPDGAVERVPRPSAPAALGWHSVAAAGEP
ncbi:MAG: CRTAC1 family protein [Halobacteriaceae archaeon]